MNKYLKDVRFKLCEVIGVEYYSVSFTDPLTIDFSWNFYQRRNFRDWFYNYLMDDKEARKYFLSFETNSKKAINAFLSDFIIHSGWRVD